MNPIDQSTEITRMVRQIRKDTEVGSDPHNTGEVSLELKKAARLIAHTLDKLAGKSEERHRGATFAHRLRHAWKIINK